MKRYIAAAFVFSGLALGCAESTEPASAAATADPTEHITSPPTEQVETAPPTTDPIDQSRTPQPVKPPETPVDPAHGQLGTSIPVDIAPGDNTEMFVRARRRMNLEQLKAQIAHATGGRAWTVGNKDQIEELADTLGRADYINTLFEDLSAGPVFQKFLGDAARSLCTEMAGDELELPADERVLMAAVEPTDTLESAPAAVEANLVQLMLRFHGLAVEHGAPVLSKYRWLFESVSHTTQDPAQGWRLVCIAMMSHPRFYSY